MNKEIELILNKIKLDGKNIPYDYIEYTGKSYTYITYQCISDDPISFSEDKPNYSEPHYDIDIYSKDNYLKIVEEVKKEFIENDFYFISDSGDSYEKDTGFFHRTIEIAKERMM